jgi:hypothetical protein
MPLPPPPAADERVRMEEALKLLRERGALKDDHCPECAHTDWNVDFLAIPATPLHTLQGGLRSDLPPPPSLRPTFSVLQSATSAYVPVCSFVCTNCGYTKNFNLNALRVML